MPLLGCPLEDLGRDLLGILGVIQTTVGDRGAPVAATGDHLAAPDSVPVPHQILNLLYPPGQFNLLCFPLDLCCQHRCRHPHNLCKDGCLCLPEGKAEDLLANHLERCTAVPESSLDEVHVLAKPFHTFADLVATPGLMDEILDDLGRWIFHHGLLEANGNVCDLRLQPPPPTQLLHVRCLELRRCCPVHHGLNKVCLHAGLGGQAGLSDKCRVRSMCLSFEI